MNNELLQGDIIKVEHIRFPVVIVSKDFFNQSGEIIGCPIFTFSSPSPLHIEIATAEIKGVVQCEKLSLLDLKIRGYKKVDRLSLSDRMNVVDAVQGIFDYI